MEDRDFSGRLIMGSMLGVKSPVIQHADTLYADIRIEPNGRFPIPPVAEERAIYTLQGNVGIGGEVFPPDRLLAFRPGDDIVVKAGPEGAHIMLLAVQLLVRSAMYGGTSFPLRGKG